MQEIMQSVHDQTVAGMNAGSDVFSLMRDVRMPSHLDVGQGYGKTAWNLSSAAILTVRQTGSRQGRVVACSSFTQDNVFQDLAFLLIAGA